MATQPEFSVRDFFALGNDAAEKSADLKIRLAQAGVLEPPATGADDDPVEPA